MCTNPTGCDCGPNTTCNGCYWNKKSKKRGEKK
jgi:hypothetical protein